MPNLYRKASSMRLETPLTLASRVTINSHQSILLLTDDRLELYQGQTQELIHELAQGLQEPTPKSLRPITTLWFLAWTQEEPNEWVACQGFWLVELKTIPPHHLVNLSTSQPEQKCPRPQSSMRWCQDWNPKKCSLLSMRGIHNYNRALRGPNNILSIQSNFNKLSQSRWMKTRIGTSNKAQDSSESNKKLQMMKPISKTIWSLTNQVMDFCKAPEKIVMELKSLGMI